MIKRIPNYALYGHSVGPSWSDQVYLQWLEEDHGALHAEIKAHQHDALLQLIYFKAGAGEVSIESQRHLINAPCVLLLPKRTVHALTVGDSAKGPVISVAQRPLESLMRIAAPELLAQLEAPAVINLPKDAVKDFAAIISLLTHEMSHSQSHRAGAMGLLLTLLTRLERIVHLDGQHARALGRHKMLVHAFQELVEQHYVQHWPLDLYAQTLGVTVSKLARVCRQELGQPPMTVVHNRVILEAQRQLAYADSSIKQIAVDLGFKDWSYFSRYFRQHAGLKPSEFRAAFSRAQ